MVFPWMAAATFGGAALTSALSVREASRNRKFQRSMSDTSYQRAVGDLKKAGLNPMLAYSQGGASTPGGAQGQIGDFSEVAGEAATAKLLRQQVKSEKARTQNLDMEGAILGQQYNINAPDVLRRASEERFYKSAAGKAFARKHLIGRSVREAGGWMRWPISSAYDASTRPGKIPVPKVKFYKGKPGDPWLEWRKK